MRGAGHLLAAAFAALISIVAVFECTHSLVLRALGVLVSIAASKAVLIGDLIYPTSLRLRITGIVVGIFVCWPVFELFRYWLGLDVFWVPSKLLALGAFRILWVFTGILYLPILVASGTGLFSRRRGAAR